MPEILLAYSNEGDWAGLYIDGKLVEEGHSLEPDDVLRMIGIEHKVLWNVNLDQYGYRLPSTSHELMDGDPLS